jgi:uncharacterized membrane protein
MIIHGTLKYQISLIYRKRQKGYDSDTITLKKYQLFDLKVKGRLGNNLFAFLDRLMIFGMWLSNDETVSHVPS